MTCTELSRHNTGVVSSLEVWQRTNLPGCVCQSVHTRRHSARTPKHFTTRAPRLPAFPMAAEAPVIHPRLFHD